MKEEKAKSYFRLTQVTYTYFVLRLDFYWHKNYVFTTTKGVNFVNILLMNFAPIFWRQKLQRLNVTGESCTRKMIMKSTPIVNFINFLQAAFAPIFLWKKIQNQTLSKEKLRKTLSYETGMSKMLVRLTRRLLHIHTKVNNTRGALCECEVCWDGVLYVWNAKW